MMRNLVLFCAAAAAAGLTLERTGDHAEARNRCCYQNGYSTGWSNGGYANSYSNGTQTYAAQPQAVNQCTGGYGATDGQVTPYQSNYAPPPPAGTAADGTFYQNGGTYQNGGPAYQNSGGYYQNGIYYRNGTGPQGVQRNGTVTPPAPAATRDAAPARTDANQLNRTPDGASNNPSPANNNQARPRTPSTAPTTAAPPNPNP